MADDETGLEWLDPNSEASLEWLVKVIQEEVDVYIAAGDLTENDAGATGRMSNVVADAILRSFVVRRRSKDEARLRWIGSGDGGGVDTGV